MADFDAEAFIEGQITAIKDTLGDKKALVAVSGGVDSTTSAVLTHRAIGDNLICVFIDDNFMRLGEAEHVKSLLSSEPLSLPVRIVNARQRFLEALVGIPDAEDKRKVFRQTFYETLGDVAKEEQCTIMVQGTIKADIDETSAGIKTQHNVLEQIGIDPVEKYGFKVIEPLKTLYKSQVREVARALGAPPELAMRQPFPGPGLSIRVVGEITPEKLEELKKATFIVEEAFEPHNPSQFFAAIFSGLTQRDLKVLKRDAAEITGLDPTMIKAGVLNENATGMIEGKRAYGSVMTLAFSDNSDNAMEPSYDQLVSILSYLQDNYPEATRLLYRVDKKDGEGYAVAMRAVKTRDFLKAEVMRIPWNTLKEAASKILNSCAGVVRVYYDVTPKPPATIEYE
ncbi:GMP synthase [Candidatus Bathyarchaeota archaeon]|nr:GMP synthase [Candidatus Bathyarchaeota archaeon]